MDKKYKNQTTKSNTNNNDIITSIEEWKQGNTLVMGDTSVSNLLQMQVWRRARGARTSPPPIFCNHSVFCNHLQAGDISISLAYSKFRVSPLEDISIAKTWSQSFKF